MPTSVSSARGRNPSRDVAIDILWRAHSYRPSAFQSAIDVDAVRPVRSQAGIRTGPKVTLLPALWPRSPVFMYCVSGSSRGRASRSRHSVGKCPSQTYSHVSRMPLAVNKVKCRNNGLRQPQGPAAELPAPTEQTRGRRVTAFRRQQVRCMMPR